MFTRLFAVASVAALAVAGPLAARDQCSNGTLQCCDSVLSSYQYTPTGAVSDLLTVVVDALVQAGVQCSPIGVLSSGSSCTQQTVCCDGTQANGVVNVECNNISL
ncbi:hypothetical protein ID866_11437 [Astraeus odoratus]|nr:hypothetical protein ID866_11437 [Astraeus odoratus]